MHSFIDNLPNFLNSISPAMRIWCYVLETSGTDVWKFPVSAYFLHKFDKLGSQENLLQSKEHLTDCAHVLYNVTRYLYAKQIGGNVLEGYDIETEMIAAAENARVGRKYAPHIKITPAFGQMLNEPISAKLRKGVCALIEFTPPGRTTAFIRKIASKWYVLNSAVVSHIVPDTWEDSCLNDKEFDDWRWSHSRVKAATNTIGNMILVERHIGTLRTLRHSILPFPTFAEKYGKSIFSETQCWTPPERPYFDVWLYPQYIRRHEHCKQELLLFLHGQNEFVNRFFNL